MNSSADTVALTKAPLSSPSPNLGAVATIISWFISLHELRLYCVTIKQNGYIIIIIILFRNYVHVWLFMSEPCKNATDIFYPLVPANIKNGRLLVHRPSKKSEQENNIPK